MTGRTARVFGMKDRGSLREDAFADLVLFDPDSVIDTATFTAPKTPARGIAEVWVNGVSSYVGGQDGRKQGRSEEHTSELQSLMRNSYAVFCLKKKHM